MLYLDEGTLIQGTLLVLPNLLRPNLLRPRIQVQYTTGAENCIDGLFPTDEVAQKESKTS